MLMAEHKVPQDVEADDKLIGPFSFRQFVYLMVALGCGFVAFVFAQIAIPLAIIPAPVCIFFLIIALPLRKDQPTEIYVAALIKYFLKPKTRIWQADGEKPLVEISNPTIDEAPKIKDLAGDEVSRRLSFLSNLSDTQGWSTRGLSAPINNTNLNDEFAINAVNAEDIMDSALSDSFDQLLDKSEQQIRQNAINQMNNMVQSQQVAAATAGPSLDATYNLPTYNYNDVILPETGVNLQTTMPQVNHNRQLQMPQGHQLQPQPTQVVAQPQYQTSMAPQQPTVQVAPQPQAYQATQPAQPVQYMSTTQTVNYQPQPAPTQTPSSQSVEAIPQPAPIINQPKPAPAVSEESPKPAINQNSQPSRPINNEVATQTKPDIMVNSNINHQPKIDDGDNDSIIDIKLH